MAKTTVIKHLTGVNYVKLMQDYIEICGYVSEKTGVIKTNDCAAALLNFYEHRHNSIIESHGESKKPINLFQESGLGFLEKVLLFHYSQKSIKEANAFLEIKGYIEIRRSRISETENAPNEVLLLVDNVNFALNEYDKIRGDKNYRTLILPHPSDKITPPPPVKLPHPSTNFTESKDNTNDNSNDNQEKETYIPFPKADKKENKGTSSDKGRSNSMRGGADEATKQAFEEFRLYAKKIGMSGARGLETEYEYFTKKHKDYETVIPILLTCLQSEVADREAKKKANEFVPAFKNFLTWVNKRAWETYEKVEVQETSEPNILQMNPQQIADHIRAKIDSKEWTEEEGKAKYKYYQDNRPKKYG